MDALPFTKTVFAPLWFPQEKIFENWLGHRLAQANIHLNGNQPQDIRVRHPRFFKRALFGGSLGLGESYMDGDWDCAHLDVFFEHVFKAGLDESADKHLPAGLLALSALFLNLQSPQRAWQVGRQHYDLSHELYANMLDSHLTYSCGYWQKTTNLEDAQVAKLNLVCRKLHLKSGMTLLDIGCGWGGMAKFAAENYGVNVVGITISQEQFQYAKRICKNLPIEIRLQDYRNLNQKFDRIVSIGMFEHVGYKNYRTFMSVAERCLNDDGLFLLHSIGGKTSQTHTDPWLDKYIFPNSMLPSSKQVTAAIENLFLIEDWHNFGADYDMTLMAWYSRFREHWGKLKRHYDERFYRMWTYYLLSCAASFRTRKNQLWQIVMAKKGVPGGYVCSR
jgi:cyclopropane-fatty-acyl-phospholipid synthase